MLAELYPLVEKAKELEGIGDAEDIYQDILKKAETASTPSMGQSVCEYVQSMTHPKAWGDRYVAGYDDLLSWVRYLSQLSAVAEQCWDQISINHPRDRSKT